MAELDQIYAQQAEAISLLTQLVKEGREPSRVEKSATGVHTATLLHGIGGLFSGAGVERDVLTAYIRPAGIGTVLPKFPSVLEDPRFSTITGYTATTGTRPANSCDNATQGYVKNCELTAYFGLNRQDTQEIEMDKVMLRANRGDHRDLLLRGKVLGMTGFTPGGLDESKIVEIVTMSEMVTAVVNLEREVSVDMWQGTVANNSFPGLDSQIATGQVDARTNTACPALDSDVKDFNYNDVGGVALDIVLYMSMMEFYLKHNASRSGLMPVQWVIVMRPELWFELSAVWPCRYMTHRCLTSGNTNPMVINDNVNVELRDNMRNGGFIDINGSRYPVITDDGIYEANNINNGNLEAGQYASSIYFVPLTIVGGMPVTFVEYLDYAQASGDRSYLRGKEDWWWTDGGMFSWSITQEKWCYMLHLKMEPRVVLRAPQLAGKIQNVMYQPLQHLRSPFADSPYFFDGGVSIIQNPGTRYAPWL